MHPAVQPQRCEKFHSYHELSNKVPCYRILMKKSCFQHNSPGGIDFTKHQAEQEYIIFGQFGNSVHSGCAQLLHIVGNCPSVLKFASALKQLILVANNFGKKNNLHTLTLTISDLVMRFLSVILSRQLANLHYWMVQTILENQSKHLSPYVRCKNDLEGENEIHHTMRKK